MKNTRKQSDDSCLDYEDMEEQIEELWEFFESEKYHTVCDTCQHILDAIEKDIADDFGEDITTETLYEDSNERRRKSYIEVLEVYKNALRSLVIELLIQTDDIKDIDPSFTNYQSLRHEIQGEIYKVAYLLGWNYGSGTFITPSGLEELDKLMREHCQFILKREFFKRFKIVIQELGNLDRKNFHKVTEPYKNLRKVCGQCLNLLDVMKDDRFFGAKDTFIEDYEKDVKIYLQILWYLGIKTDLNKIDKFLNPNTYSGGLDAHCQIFAALSLMQQVIPHLKDARNVGLSNKASKDLLEEYTEYLYKIITHEEGKIKEEGLQQLWETDRIVSEGYTHDYYKGFDLSLPEDAGSEIEKVYGSLDDLKHGYAEKVRNEAAAYILQKDIQEFEDILEKASRGVGVREEPVKGKAKQAGQKKRRRVYRYEYNRNPRIQEPVVFVITRKGVNKREFRLLHKAWVEALYVTWKKLKKLKHIHEIIEQHTERQEKTKYQMDFAIKFFKKKFFAFRLGEHKRIAIPNPEGRILRGDTNVVRVLEFLQEPLFSAFFEELKMLYRSRSALKVQKLRWSWFAERELKEGHFEKPKYNYIKYIHTRWKEKVKAHYATLRQLSKRKDDED